MTALFAIPYGLEAWEAVFGGLIPIVGLAGIGYLIYYAVRSTDEDDDEPPT